MTYIKLFQPPCDGEDNFKLVLIVRSDLKMGKGKVAAQVQHVSWIVKLLNIADFSEKNVDCAHLANSIEHDWVKPSLGTSDLFSQMNEFYVCGD